MESLRRSIKKIIPRSVFKFLEPVYHYLLAYMASVWYGSPSRNIKVIAVTGTKGKTSTVEFINSILEEAGYKTALAGTMRFKINDASERNMYKMTMPGRFFVQRFLKKAVSAGCDYAILEMTSEAARQFRHKFIDFNALVFLNLSPEHIESHGSYEKYVAAKLSLAKALEESSKENKVLIVNSDDKESKKFLDTKIEKKFGFTLLAAEPFMLKEEGVEITFSGIKVSSPFPGTFTVYNILAASTFALSQGIPVETIKKGIEKVKEIPGRVQKILVDSPLQNFSVFVDYAHTPDSLEKLYEAFGTRRKICVLGNTGGGRDKWKRSEMGKIADAYCNEIILTNEDPYDEDPRSIIEEMKKGFTVRTPTIIMDRREAIAEALSRARPGDIVLITGKGTDPYIMEANGKKTPWSDEEVTREELKKLLASSS